MKRFLTANYSYLLILLIILFAFRPYDKGVEYLAIWKAFFTLTLLSAIFNCKHPHKVRIAALVFAIPTLIFSWLELFYVEPLFFLFNVCSTIIFLFICTGSVLYDVILYARVTAETLRGVVCAYFMIAFLFAFIYYLLEYFVPGSFRAPVYDVSFVTYSRNLSEMMYFSFVTLLTIGFGDVTPMRDYSQTVVVLEGIVGQFYVAILVARIVSVYTLYTEKRMMQQKLKKKKR